jgi:hypothetical protein
MKRSAVLLSIAVVALLVLSACVSSKPASGMQAMAAPAPAAAAAPAIVTTVDDFEGNNLGGKWSVYSDVAANKGSSVANPDPFVAQNDPGNGANGTDHFAKCWGSVTTQYQYGFAGLTYDFDPDDPTKILDLSGSTGFKFWMKGDGRTYHFGIKAPSVNKDFDFYEYTIATKPGWTEYTIPFTKFNQESWGASMPLSKCLKAATGFQIQTIGQPIDKFEFYLDEVSLY